MTIFNWSYFQQEVFHRHPYLHYFEYRHCQVQYAEFQDGYKIQIQYPLEVYSIVSSFVSKLECNDVETYCKSKIDAAACFNTSGKRLIATLLANPLLPRWVSEWREPSQRSVDDAIHLLRLASTEDLVCTQAPDGILLENFITMKHNTLLVHERSLIYMLQEWHHLVTQVVTYKSSYTILNSYEMPAMQRLLKHCFGISKAPLSKAIFR